MPAPKVAIPRVDPNVQYVGVSKLRTLNATNLHDLDTTFVIQDNDKPLAVVISYDLFLEMQKERERVLTTLEMLANSEELTALRAGMDDMLSKRTKPISAVRDGVKKRVRS